MSIKQTFGLALIIFIVGEVVGSSGLSLSFDLILYSVVMAIANMFIPAIIAIVVFAVGKFRKKHPTGGLKVMAICTLIMCAFQTIGKLIATSI